MHPIGNGHEREYRRPTTHRSYYRRNYRDHEGCYKSQRRGRAVVRQDTVAVSLISLKEKPYVEIHDALCRETLISYVAATRKIDTIRARVLVPINLFFLSLSGHSYRGNKIPDRRVVYRFIATSYVFTFNAECEHVRFGSCVSYNEF